MLGRSDWKSEPETGLRVRSRNRGMRSCERLFQAVENLPNRCCGGILSQERRFSTDERAFSMESTIPGATRIGKFLSLETPARQEVEARGSLLLYATGRRPKQVLKAACNERAKKREGRP